MTEDVVILIAEDDAGHFALESRVSEIAAIIRDFLARRMN